MKCPGCGAEGKGKFCEYCGSQLPQEKTEVHITNNYYGAAPEGSREVAAPGGKCPRCGHSGVSFQREWTNGKTGSAYATVGLCQNCGYTWNPEAGSAKQNRPRKTWLWVLGWIFLFPLPLTVLLLRKKDMNPLVKYGIIAAAWIMYFVIGMSG